MRETKLHQIDYDYLIRTEMKECKTALKIRVLVKKVNVMTGTKILHDQFKFFTIIHILNLFTVITIFDYHLHKNTYMLKS